MFMLGVHMTAWGGCCHFEVGHVLEPSGLLWKVRRYTALPRGGLGGAPSSPCVSCKFSWDPAQCVPGPSVGGGSGARGGHRLQGTTFPRPKGSHRKQADSPYVWGGWGTSLGGGGGSDLGSFMHPSIHFPPCFPGPQLHLVLCGV